MEEAQTLEMVQPSRVTGASAITFTREQVELIKRTVAKGTTDDELTLFLYTAKRMGLDPLAKQIHCVKRGKEDKESMSIQTAIDGYRLIADRTGKYAGNDDPVFDDEANPRKATVSVYKIVEGVRCPFTATARWEQYFPGEKQGFMWKKMPHLMLGKCAEALALRKAFPAELSGVYINEEMEQADKTEPEKPPIQQPTPKQETGKLKYNMIQIDKIESRQVQKKDKSGTFEALKVFAKDGWVGELAGFIPAATVIRQAEKSGEPVNVGFETNAYGHKIITAELETADAQEAA